jgi:hypothetical protein
LSLLKIYCDVPFTSTQQQATQDCVRCTCIEIRVSRVLKHTLSAFQHRELSPRAVTIRPDLTSLSNSCVCGLRKCRSPARCTGTIHDAVRPELANNMMCPGEYISEISLIQMSDPKTYVSCHHQAALKRLAQSCGCTEKDPHCSWFMNPAQ